MMFGGPKDRWCTITDSSNGSILKLKHNAKEKTVEVSISCGDVERKLLLNAGNAASVAHWFKQIHVPGESKNDVIQFKPRSFNPSWNK